MQKEKLELENPYMPRRYMVIDFHRETSDVFTIKVNMKCHHEPGQFVQVSIPGVGECPISICSYSKDYINLSISEVGRMTKALSNLRKGNPILIRGPYGKGYPLDVLKGKDLVIIGGGCGVAPVRSVIGYIESNRKDFGKVFMFLGYGSPDDILFRRDLQKWKRKHHVSVTVDKNISGKFCYGAKVGFVTQAVDDAKLTPMNKIVLICGPPIMLRVAVDILKSRGFNDSQIFISAERLMYCAIGACCHCMIRGKYTCVDGPVFRYDQISQYQND